MPNPFVRLQASTSKTDVDRPVIETPIPEDVAGHNFAYRGFQTHGVDPNNSNHDPENYGYQERMAPVDYENVPDPVDPIPVIIVQRGGRELRLMRVTRALTGVLGSNPVMVVGGDPLRRKVSLINTGADSVFLGHDQQSASPMHGYPLAGGATFETDSANTPVWAQSSTANAMTLAIRVEYTILVGPDE